MTRAAQRQLCAILVGVAASTALASSALAADDDLAMYRDRFHLGMEKYKAGSVGEAIRIWSAIYEELGTKRGYRLAFDLARAYDTNGEATRAAERYRAFLDEAALRKKAGESLEAIVEREVHDAEERMTELNQDHGRIEVSPGADAVLAQVDDADPRLGAFTAYVAPGKHVVTFGPGRSDAERVELTVAAGELIVAHPAFHPPAQVHAAPLLSVDPIPRKILKHPFSPVVLYVGVVVTAGSVAAPALAYGYAYSLYNTATSTQAVPANRNNAAANYPAARSLAYGMLVIPISLAAVTGGLTTFYFAATTERTVAISFDVVPTPTGARAMMTARF